MGKGWKSGRSIENPPFQNMQKVGLPVSFFSGDFCKASAPFTFNF